MNKPISEIKADPNQPRKVFSDERIKKLSISLLHEGMINPIEIDENGIIITGENRFRAAKLIGWTEVPVNINKTPYSPYQRIKHQVAENVHQSGGGETPMNPIDLAEAFKWLLEQKGFNFNEYYGGIRPGRMEERFKSQDHYIEELSKDLSIGIDTIYEHLHLLNQPDFVIKAVKEDTTPRTYFREIERINLPQEQKDLLKKEAAEGKIKSRDDIMRIAKIARQNKDLAIEEIERMKEDIVDPKTSKQTNRILNAAIELMLSLEAITFNKVHGKEKRIVSNQLSRTAQKIEEYLLVEAEIIN